jgi:peptidoglycan/xylan/chitin deacetylase (PgdA/CDA1 family)
MLLGVVAARAASGAPLGLVWGVVAEPAGEGALTLGRLAEHLEFLQAHGRQAVRATELAAGSAPAQSVLLTFDDPAGAARYVLPLLELYQTPATVTVSAAQLADASLAPALATLAHSPWVELVPRVEPAIADEQPEVRCAPTAVVDEEAALSRLRAALAEQVSALHDRTGRAPVGVAWAPGTWSGPAEAVAKSLGLTLQLPTFTTMPPEFDGRSTRVALFAVPSWAGIWAVAQASARWNPDDHPVRFVEVDAGWICSGNDPATRVAEIVGVVRKLALNGVRLRVGDAQGVWFPTTVTTVRGDVAGPLARTLHRAGVRWVAVDVPTTGDRGRDVALAADLARAVELDVALLPAGATAQDRLGEAVQYVRPAARVGWRGEAGLGERAFRLTPFATDRPAERGATVASAAVAAANQEATDLAIGGWDWVGLPIELARSGLDRSLRSLAAFALPNAGAPPAP